MLAQTTTRQPSREQRVLALVERLAGKLDEYDLDGIDGEFYWQLCRTDFVEKVAQLRACGFYRNHEALSFVQTTLDEFDREHHLSGPALYAHIEHDTPLPLRPPEVYPFTTMAGEHVETRLVIKVMSGSWRGVDVVHYLETWLKAEAKQYSFLQEDPRTRSVWASYAPVSVRFDFALHEAKAEAGGDSPPPYVEMLIGIPLPPGDVIAWNYDAMVREHLGWVERLRPSTPQETSTAMRTWGVGLLVASGVRFGDAMRKVCQVGRLVEASQSSFDASRRSLLARVPEAKPFLMQRVR